MNLIPAKVKSIENIENLNIVRFDFAGKPIEFVSLELTNVALEQDVILGLKPFHLSVAKNINGLLSCQNQLSAKLEDIDKGKLLSSLGLMCRGVKLQSIITTKKLNEMDLKKGEILTLLIEASNLFLAEQKSIQKEEQKVIQKEEQKEGLENV